MVKITKFYLNKASYIAIDRKGNKADVNIDYWGNNFSLSEPNKSLENLAKDLLERKHKVNFVGKLLK